MVQLLNHQGESIPLDQGLGFEDPAVQFGAGGAFETIRVEGGRCHLYWAHQERLERALGFLGLRIDFPSAVVEQALREELNRFDPGAALRMRLTVGCDPDASVGEHNSESPARMWIEARPLGDEYLGPAGTRRRYRTTLFPDYYVTAGDPWRRHKTTRYFAHWEARRRARLRGFDEAILLNERGEVVEGSMHNLFWIARGRLYTPPSESGPLPGTFSAYVRRIAGELDIETYAVAARPPKLREAEGVFLTNALAEIRDVSSIDGWGYTPLNEHPVGKLLLERVETERESRGDFAPGGARPAGGRSKINPK
jgi:branched-subunit amino acid aminotransferase/4-amino-4-deoxychorismate lyase